MTAESYGADHSQLMLEAGTAVEALGGGTSITHGRVDGNIDAPSAATMRLLLIERWELLSAEQMLAISRILEPAPASHARDFRVSLPLSSRSRAFIRVIVGRERRDAARLRLEGQLHLGRIALAQSAIVILMLAYSLFGLVCFLYLMKSLLRINLIAGKSILHPLYDLFVL